MGNSSKVLEATRRKSRFPILAIVCIVLFFGVALLIQSSTRNGIPPEESTISQIISEPMDWENRPVEVSGTAEEIPIGIVQPFNYWLFDKQNRTVRIGLSWHHDIDISGKGLTVVGIVKKGYAWVNPNYPGWWTYYIEATSIYEDWRNSAAQKRLVGQETRRNQQLA